MRKAIAIDFDGCLCTNAYPEIGEPIWPVIRRAKAEQEAGAGLILWTCREGQLLLDAIDACEGWGLSFNTVNESLPDWIEAFGTKPRKVGASEYWDDKAVRLPDIIPADVPLTLEELREMDGEPVWCVVNGIPKNGYYCLCDSGLILAPSGSFFNCSDIPNWIFCRRKPEEG